MTILDVQIIAGLVAILFVTGVVAVIKDEMDRKRHTERLIAWREINQ